MIKVSILVFMDLSLEDLGGRQRAALNGVSILVFMDLSLEENSFRSPTAPKYVSILVFMDLSLEDGCISASSQDQAAVSILVFMDLSLEAKGPFQVYSVITVFQSLFSWISLWK